jgi:hypothetical protein
MSLLHSHSHNLLAIALTATALAACSPTFNWREVPIGDDGLVALLPCKPDRATRQLPLGTESVAVDMAGCEAGGATFAVAHATASSGAQAEGWMRAWREATRSQLAGAQTVETAALLPRAATAPAPARLDTQIANAGEGAAAHVLWFAQQRAGGVSLYQATVLGKPSSPEALATFFDGLHLP